MRRRAGGPIDGELEGGVAEDDNPLFGAANGTNGVSPDANVAPVTISDDDARESDAFIEKESGDAIYMFLFCGGALFQFLLLCSLWCALLPRACPASSDGDAAQDAMVSRHPWRSNS